MAVERLQCEPAGIDLAAFIHEFCELVVEVLRAREGFVADLRKAALDTERDTGTVKQNRSLKTLPLQPQRLENIDEADGAFERDGVEGDECLLTGLCFDVLENLLFIVDKKVTLLTRGHVHCWHRHLLFTSGPPGSRSGFAINVPSDVLHYKSSCHTICIQLYIH